MKESLPINVLTRPVNLTTTKKSFMAQVIRTMYSQRLSIGPITEKSEQTIFHTLPEKGYRKLAKEIIKRNLFKGQDLKLLSDDTRLASFEQWKMGRLPGNKTFTQIPKYFQYALRFHGEIDLEEDISLEFETNFPKRQPRIQIVPVISGNQGETFQVYTDGSLNENMKMGCSAIIYGASLRHYHTVRGTPPPGNESSTKAELWAIFLALKNLPSNKDVEILTDSQAAIDAIRARTSSTRDILKFQNHVIITAIKHLITTCRSFSITKVAGHTGIEGNELADQAAREAINSGNPITLRSTDFHVLDNFLHKDKEPIEVYPRRHIKNNLQDILEKELGDRANELWNLEDIDVKKTMSLAKTGMNQENYLDASKTKEQSDRLKIIHKKLPTLDKVRYYKAIKSPMPIHHGDPRASLYLPNDHQQVRPD